MDQQAESDKPECPLAPHYAPGVTCPVHGRSPLPSREALREKIRDLTNDDYSERIYDAIMSEIDQFTTTLKERVLAELPQIMLEETGPNAWDATRGKYVTDDEKLKRSWVVGANSASKAARAAIARVFKETE